MSCPRIMIFYESGAFIYWKGTWRSCLKSEQALGNSLVYSISNSTIRYTFYKAEIKVLQKNLVSHNRSSILKLINAPFHLQPLFFSFAKSAVSLLDSLWFDFKPQFEVVLKNWWKTAFVLQTWEFQLKIETNCQRNWNPWLTRLLTC